MCSLCFKPYAIDIIINGIAVPIKKIPSAALKSRVILNINSNGIINAKPGEPNNPAIKPHILAIIIVL
jgi:hypothetical protein